MFLSFVESPGVPAPTMSTTAPSGMFGLEMELACAEPAALSDAELVDAAVGFERMVAWAAARQHAVLAEFARRGGEGPVREWAGDEVALALTVSRGSGQVRLAQARRLDGPLRATRDLLQAGEIDVSRARLIVDRCAVLDDDKATAVQDKVLAKAPDQTWAQLDSALRRAILAVDPDGAAERHAAAKKERRVDVFREDDGMATLWARMTAPDAAASFEWLTRLARGMGADDERTLDQRRADLLAAALTGKLVIRDPEATDLEHATPVTPGKPLITVLVPLTTLTGADDEPCEITGYGPIPAHLARDIAADAVWRRLVTDPLSGAVLDHGRCTYRPPAALADFVRARDVVCRHPRCRRAAATCELDHVIPWDPDGTTSEANLAALCTAHHDLKEQPGWAVVLHPDRSMEWITPTGHRYRSDPYDHRVG
ncbi:DUF222 domain-containing protein [Pseudonocardia saturnea]